MCSITGLIAASVSKDLSAIVSASFGWIAYAFSEVVFCKVSEAALVVSAVAIVSCFPLLQEKKKTINMHVPNFFMKPLSFYFKKIHAMKFSLSAGNISPNVSSKPNRHKDDHFGQPLHYLALNLH
jgi:hypothetical protein